MIQGTESDMNTLSSINSAIIQSVYHIYGVNENRNVKAFDMPGTQPVS